MLSLMRSAGLSPPIVSPPIGAQEPVVVVTQEAGVAAPDGKTPRVEMLVEDGDIIAQGAPLARLRHAPNVQFVAPMPCRVGKITLLPGRRLSEIVVYQERGGDVLQHKTEDMSPQGLRDIMQLTGFWHWVRRRPFGGVPRTDETPAAIFVMAADTRPLAPDPGIALAAREEGLLRGLSELGKLTNGPVFLCKDKRSELLHGTKSQSGFRTILCGPRHPQGAAGFQIHAHFPATLSRPVWEIHAEDVAALGELVQTGILPMNRYVTVAGPMVNESRVVVTQVGADIRELTQKAARRAPHTLLSGSLIDGTVAHWIAPRDRQISVMAARETAKEAHWLIDALTQSSKPKPIIPTAALDQSLAFAVPAALFVRALSAGDDEALIKLGGLSFLPDDLALADYALGGQARLTGMLSTMLARIQSEYAP